MQVAVKNMNGVNELSLEAMLTLERIVCLEGAITDEAALGFAKQIAYYVAEDDRAPIKLYIMSDGGSVDAGMVIYDILATTETPIEVYCLGKAHSIAALIFAGGRHGRYMLPSSKIFLHEPLASQVMVSSSSVQELSADLSTIREKYEELLAEHTGRSREEVATAMKEHRHFTAEEAVEFGLADGIRNFGAWVGRS